ncbi:hypothetical protein T265_14120, partial [Opisthorchis viverrini]
VEATLKLFPVFRILEFPGEEIVAADNDPEQEMGDDSLEVEATLKLFPVFRILEFPGEEIVAADNDPEQEMGDDSLEVTDEMIDAANDKRSEAQAKMSVCMIPFFLRISRIFLGDLEAAVALFTEAIKLNPTSALLYARRASCFIKLKKPCAALKDCEKALHLNPDSAAPYKWRGFAHKMLGHWEEAFNDFQTSLKLDYSEDAYEAMKDVEPKQTKSSDIVVVASDMNAHVGWLSATEARLGCLGLDTRRADNGDRLLEVCADHRQFLLKYTQNAHTSLSNDKSADPEFKRNYQNQHLERIPDGASNARLRRLSPLESHLGGRFGVDACGTANGNRLLQLYADHELLLASTKFQHKHSHRVAWRSATTGGEPQFKTAVSFGAPLGSDHAMVHAWYKISLLKREKSPAPESLYPALFKEGGISLVTYLTKLIGAIWNGWKALYANSRGRVKVYGKLSPEFTTSSGVRLDCPLSPFLFKFVIDTIMEDSLTASNACGVEVLPGPPLTDVEYADDIALLGSDPVHKRIYEHNMKYKRKREERLDRERRERIRKAQESRERAKQESPFNGASRGADNMGDTFSQLFNDPELIAAIQDPEVMKAFGEVSSNPAAMHKYKDNPKVKRVLEKMQDKFGGLGGGLGGERNALRDGSGLHNARPVYSR